MNETALEVETNMDAASDATLIVGSTRVRVIYEEPQAEDLLVEGSSPMATSLRRWLEDAGITLQTDVDEIQLDRGETRGPFRVVRYQSQADGVMVTLGLEKR